MTNNNYKRTIAVFDLDNTLIDSQAKLNADFVGAMSRLGITITPEEIKAGKWYETAQKYGFSKEAFDKAFDQRKTWEQSLADGEVPIFPETRGCLEELASRGIRMSLLSKSIPKYTKQKVDYFGLNKYFEQIVTVHPEEPNKTKGAIELIIKMNPCAGDYAAFIGDKEEDVAIASIGKSYKLNAKGIYVNRDGLILPDYASVKNLSEVNKKIIKNGR